MSRRGRIAWGLTLVSLPLMSGCYLSHTIGAPRDAGASDAPRVDARDATPRDAPDRADTSALPTCELTSADEWIVPVAVVGGDFTTQIPIGMRFHTGGCSCTPRPVAQDGRVGAELCACCDGCDCMPPSYEATVLQTEPAGIGSFTPVALNGAVGPSVEVVDWAVGCTPILETADFIEILIPNGVATPARPVGVWAHVTGIHFRCSDRVLPVLSTDAAGSFLLEDCSPDIDPCGPITPTPYDTNVFLGFYEPGVYRTRAFGTTLEFAVP